MDSLIDLSSQLVKLTQIVDSLLLQSRIDKRTKTEQPSAEQLQDIINEITLNTNYWNKQLGGLVKQPSSDVLRAINKVQENLPNIITILVLQQLSKK